MSRTGKRTRATVPAPTTQRAALYIRVSSEEQIEGYSLDAQERAGKMYCELNGWQITRVYRDEGKSARVDDIRKRPAFAEMIEDAERGAFEAVIVHKLDRFARNLVVTIETLQRLEAAGVAFVSISENMDFSTPIGRMTLSMLATLAQYYSDNLSWETRKGKQERKRQGLYNGLLPFGVTTNSAGIPVLDERPWACNLANREELTPAAGLRLAFTLAAEGRSDKEVARALNAAGYRTSGNRGQNPFTKDSVRPMLQNRFYLGELPDDDGGWLPAKHGALLDPALFEAAERARRANQRSPRRVSSIRTPWALSGLGVCGSCGGPLKLTGTQGGKRRIQCANRAQGGDCDEPSCFTTVIEDQVSVFLRDFTIPAERRERFMHAWRQTRRPDDGAAAQRRKLERNLARVRELYLEGDLSREEYHLRRDAVQRELDALPTPNASGADAAAQVMDFVANVTRAWEAATPEERNRLARGLFTEAIVSNQTAVAVAPRPEVRPYFEAVLGGEITLQRKRRDSNPRSQP